MSLKTFNAYPYFDDFESKQNYLKTLFKPGRNVQVRELNGIQSTQHDQVKKFASNIFKSGSRVNGGRYAYSKLKYIIPSVAITDLTFQNIISNPENYKITGANGVAANIVHAEYDYDGLQCLFINYSSVGTNGSDTEFSLNLGITIITNNNTLILNALVQTISAGQVFLIDDAVFYYDGYFINSGRQQKAITFSETDSSEWRIGFDVVEEILNSTDSPELKDNANGFDSFDTDGSDRYKLHMVLTKRSIDYDDGNKFITIGKITPHGVDYLKDDTEYSVWGDFLARRTYEESGNYTLNPIDLKILNHKATSVDDPLGYDVNGSPGNYVAVVGKHISYISGYRVENKSENTYIISRRAIDTITTNSGTEIVPRIDLIVIDKTGKIYIKNGISAFNPVAPKVGIDEMAIFEIHLSFGLIVPVRIDNRRYTMREIGKIENRIKNMEYYTSLSLIDKSANSMEIKDANGLNRFKNGFIADDFSTFQAADLTSPDFGAALDRKYKELRPSFDVINRKFSFNISLSSNYINKSNVLMLDYNEIVIDSQPFATKTLSINPYFVTAKHGFMTISPNIDTWADTSTEPDINVTIDSGVEAFKNVAGRVGVLNTEWASWTQTNRTALSITEAGNTTATRRGTPLSQGDVDRTTSINATNPPSVFNDRTSTTTVTLQERREGLAKSIGERTDTHSWQDVSDITITPYIRPQTIKFEVKGLSPETVHYMFFDGVDITDQARMSEKNAGTGLLSDVNGFIKGEFTILANKFFTGQKSVVITNVKNYEAVRTDDEFSSASSSFFSGGLDLTKQTKNLNVITPTWHESVVSENKTTVTTTSSIIKAQERPQIQRSIASGGAGPASPPPEICCCCGADPIAQSFTPSQDMMVTSIDLFFSNLDTINSDMWVAIRELENGYPTPNDIGIVYLNTSSLKSSSDSLIPSNIKFDTPIFVSGNKEYCFVVGGWSPSTRVWVSKLGDPLINDSSKTVDTQPSLGSSFRSQNGSTWNAEQYEDIKYNLYCAEFKSDSLSLAFNTIDEETDLIENPFECEAGTEFIRVYNKSHGMTSGDKFTIKMLEDGEYTLKSNTGTPPVEGQTIYTSSGRAIIKTVVYAQSTGVIKITVKNMVGVIKVGDAFSTETLDIVSNAGSTISRIAAISGTVTAGPLENIAGIPIEYLNGEHVVYKADSANSFVFSINSANVPTSSGRFGGKNIKILSNFKFDVFNVSLGYMLYGSSEHWSYAGTIFNKEDGVFLSKKYQKYYKDFTPGDDVHLDIPNLLANDSNSNSSIKDKNSVTITSLFKSSSKFVSPVINLDSMSIIAISNNVDNIIPATMDIAPLANTHYRNETLYNSSEPYKYVTKTVQLQNPAIDLMIAVDVYKDKNSDFSVYYKTLQQHDTSNIDVDVDWIEVPITIKKNNVDLEDMTSYELLLSDVFSATWKNDKFSLFKIKLVGKSNNSAKPVIFKNFRAIAIT